MKVRLGFVSNSSTTSFCLFGFCDDSNSIKEKLLKLNADITDDEDFIEDIYDISEKAGMECYTHPYGENTYIGFGMSSIPDDVKVGEWKKEKEIEIKKIFGKDVSCDIVEDGWRDG